MWSVILSGILRLEWIHLQRFSELGAGACFCSATVAGMNKNILLQIENNIRYADCRHPIDFIEPLPNGDESIRRTCEVLS